MERSTKEETHLTWNSADGRGLVGRGYTGKNYYIVGSEQTLNRKTEFLPIKEGTTRRKRGMNRGPGQDNFIPKKMFY